MSTTVGTLTIEMAANIVRLQQDMDKARNSVENTMAKISKAAGAAGVALGALGVTVGVGAFASWIRGAIDAADETSKLAQKIGVAVPQIAGLQLAFRQSGIDAGALQTSMSKLSVAIADGNDAFVAMGISTKNADGTLKSTRDILGEVADKFKGYEDGAAKTALAVKLFGKAGADLIPLLNGGADALDDFDKMAKKLGLTLDEDTAKRAEKFNDTLDLMGQGFSGISRQVAAQLLPTLEGLADQFFSAMTEGDRLKVIGDALATGMKALYVAGVALVGGFRAVGDTLYAVGAQVVAVMKGDFAGAVKAGERWAGEMKTNWTGSLAEIEKAWSANGSTAVSTMAAVTAATRQQAPVVADAAKKQTDALDKQEDAYRKLLASINDKVAAAQAELDQGAKLTPAQQMEVKLLSDIESGTVKLTTAQRSNIQARIDALKAIESQNAETKLEKQILDDSAKANAAYSDAMAKSTADLIKQAEKQRDANDALTLGKDALAQIEIEKLRADAKAADRKANWATEAGLTEDIAQGYKDQADALRNLADLKEQGIHVKSAQDAADAWAKATDSITNDLSDALMRGFESGKGFFDNMADYVRNKFKTLLSENLLKPAIGSVVRSAGSMLGITAGTGANAGSLMMGGATLGAQGAAFGEGFTTAVSGWFTGGAEVASMGSATSGAFGAGASAAAAVPYVAAALVAANALGLMRSTNIVGGGLTGTLGEGDITSYDLQRRGGTLFNGPSYSMVNTQISELSNYLQTSFKDMRNAAARMATTLGKSSAEVEAFTMVLGDVRVHPDIDQLGLVLDGLTDEQKTAKIQAAFTAAQEGLASLVLGATDLQRAGETAYEALQRLSGLQAISESLNQFGGAFSNFASASVSARQSIVDLAGGLESLVQKAQGFVANFYTREEQAAITAKGVVNALTQTGFTQAQIATLETRADFRALLESIDVNTDLGQRQFVALLNLQQQYSDLAPILEEQNKSLMELLDSAPQVEILQKIFESDEDYATRTADAAALAQETFNSMDNSLAQVVESTDQLTIAMRDGLMTLSEAVNSTIETSNAQIIALRAEIAAQAAADANTLANQIAAVVASATATQEALLTAITSGSSLSAGTETVESSLSASGAGSSLNTFASGGYMNGMGLVGEHGPELFDPRTSQIYTAPATSNIFGGNEVAAEIRALRDEVSMMRSETRSTAVNTAKIARLQDNWDVRGLTVKTDVDQPLDTVTV